MCLGRPALRSGLVVLNWSGRLHVRPKVLRACRDFWSCTPLVVLFSFCLFRVSCQSPALNAPCTLALLTHPREVDYEERAASPGAAEGGRNGGGYDDDYDRGGGDGGDLRAEDA